MGYLPANVWVRFGRIFYNASVARLYLALFLLLAGWSNSRAVPLEIAGNHAFHADSLGRLQILNIANGTNPIVVATYTNFGGVSGISLHGAYASVTLTNDGFVIFNVSQPQPTLVTGGRFVTAGAARDLQVSANTAFVADGSNGIELVDVFDLYAPISLAVLTPPGNVSAVEVVSNRLYAACGSGGLRVYNITFKNNPSQMGTRNTASAAQRLRVQGNHAYVACNGGRLEIVNIQNPNSPSLAATYLGGGSFADVDVAGNYALLGNTNGNIVLLNVSNPAAPVGVSTNFVAGGARAVRLVGTNAYVRTTAGSLIVIPVTGPPALAPQLQQAVTNQLVAAGQTAYMSVLASGTPPLSFQWRKDGVVLTNDSRISGATNAWLVISNTVTADTGNYAVTVTNAFGQLVSSNVLTVVNPGTPVFRQSFNPGGTVEDVTVKDLALYLADGTNGLEIYSVVNPRYPDRIGGNDITGFSSGVQVAGINAFLGTGDEGLQIYSINDLPVAKSVAVTNTAGAARNVFLAGGLIYLADGENGLQIFQHNGSATPVFVASTNTPGYVWNVFAADGLAYVADGTNGLHIYSVTNPAALTPLGTYDSLGEVRNVEVHAGKAYVADGAGGLLILDVSNPASPTLLGSYTNAAPAVDLDFAGNLVVVARGPNGVETLDVSNPASIVSRGVHLVNPANAVILEGNRLYVAAGANGVQICELVGISVTAPNITITPPDVIVLAGTNVSFSASATGTAPLTYQWFKNGLALANNSNRQGVATATLNFLTPTLEDSGTYVLEVRNAWNFFDSISVELTVVAFGTPVFQSGYFYQGDALSTHVVGQVAFVASRLDGLQAVDWRNPFDPVLIGQHATLDLAQDVRVQGRYAYVASWSAGLEIFDVLNPTNLVRVGQCDTPGLARQIRVSGSRVYVADSAAGFSIIDVSDPTRPALIGTATTSGFAEGLFQASNHVFVAAADTGLQVFNTVDPLAPTWLSQLDTPGHATQLTLANNRAYIADHQRGLQIVDVSDPGAPTWLGEFPTDGDAFQVQVVSNRAYIASGISKISVVDVSNPEAPAFITTSLTGESVRNLQVIGHQALLADRNSGLMLAELLGMSPIAPNIVDFIRSGTAVVGRELVLSVASEGTPPLSYTWFANGTPLANSATVSGVNQPHLRFPALATTNTGNYTVVVSNAEGSITSAVATVTVTALGAPVARGIFDTPGSATAAVVYGNIGFIADGATGLRMVNLTNLDSPTAFGSYAPTGSVFGLCLQTNLLYLALGSNGVAIVDVSTPAQPVHVGAFDTPGNALNLDVTNGRAFVADGTAGLRIYNVTNPASPTALGFLDTPGNATDVRIVNNLAYVADGGAGLKIISVTNAAAPIQIGSYSNAAPVNAVRVVTNRVYLANGNLGLRILDVTNPAAPVSLGSYPTTNATALDLIGNLVLLANGAGGYLVLDVSNPAAIALIGSANPGDAINGAMLVGNLALLSSGTNGLRLVELSGVAPRAPAFLTQPANTAVLYGGTAQFNALPANGTPPLSYRWYYGGLPVFDDARISGAGTTKLTITNVGFTDAGSYQLRVLGPAGVTNSAPAQLTFIGPLQAQINAAATGAVINLSNDSYTETLVLDRNLTLNGQWWDKPVLNGGHAGTVLRVLPGANVTVRGVAIRNGTTSGNGGGVLNEGTLTLDHCLIADNSAAYGGGIANLKTLVVLQSVISNNYALTAGGGLYTAPSAVSVVTNSTFTENLSDVGGGLANVGTNTFVSSLLANNFASGLNGVGGGVHSTTGSVQLINTTVSGNAASSVSGLAPTGRGGGLHASGGRLELHFSTVATNAALVQGGGVAAVAPAEVHARNSVFADNSAPTGLDYNGTLYSGGYNLVQSSAGLTVTGTNTGNQLNVNAKLGPLLDNGGPTLTHAPAADSPVIDAGAAPGPATDARGIKRPFDIPWSVSTSGSFDLGAFEYADRTPYLIVSNRTAVGFNLVWATNTILQKSTTSTASWTDQTNLSPLYVSTLTNTMNFFRLRATLPSVVLTTNNVTTNSFDLAWPDFGILEHAPTTNGPWEPLSGISPYHVTIVPGQPEFFRLRVLSH